MRARVCDSEGWLKLSGHGCIVARFISVNGGPESEGATLAPGEFQFSIGERSSCPAGLVVRSWENAKGNFAFSFGAMLPSGRDDVTNSVYKLDGKGPVNQLVIIRSSQALAD